MTDRTGVMIGTPAASGVVRSQYAESLAATCGELVQLGIVPYLQLMPNCGLLSFSRAWIVSQFMSSIATHLLFVDADIEWQAEDVIRLLEHDLDFVAGLYRTRSDRETYVFADLTEHPQAEPVILHRDAKLIEVAGVGLGFVLLRRRVIEQMIAAFPELQVKKPPNGAAPTPFLYDLFACGVDDAGDWIGEDYGFCRRYRSIGGRIFADPTIKLRHHGSMVFEGTLASRLGGPWRVT